MIRIKVLSLSCVKVYDQSPDRGFVSQGSVLGPGSVLFVSRARAQSIIKTEADVYP